MIVKKCKTHGDLIESDCTIEFSDGYKCYRCIFCKREKDQRWKEKNKEKHRASAGKARKEARRLFREGITNEEPKANIWNKEDRKNKTEIYKERDKKRRKELGALRNIQEISRRRGITIEQYYALVSTYENKCAICKKEETRKARNDNVARLCIDHCHKTNIVRGLLCHDCNTGIGKFKDSKELLSNAIKYLEKFKT